MAKDFLVEIGTEELPPKSLKTLSSAFSSTIESLLKEHQLAFQNVITHATPRRIAVTVEQLDEQTPLTEVSVWGPPAKIAFDEQGNPSKAAQAFARKNAIAIEQLTVENDGKIDKLVHHTTSGGEQTINLLENVVETALSALPVAKRMRWGANRNEFVRPVHWILMLFGNEIPNARIMGIKASGETRGHRFHYNQTLVIDNPAEYAQKLLSPGKVMVDFSSRRQVIAEQVTAEAQKAGGQAVIDEDLLDEVTALVEWPVALLGKFEAEFLQVPSEALISSMKEHQKYFHVVEAKKNDEQTLLPYFITVSNIESQDPQQVIDGNERVIRPRLSDAAFFYKTDLQSSLEQQRTRLTSIVFQKDLGSIFDKTQRVAQLARAIADRLQVNATLAVRAAELSKADLVTQMVNEFSDMQGIAGYYYALHDGEDREVAQAMKEQYLPRFAGDKLPETTTGTVLALADRLDTLAGIFGIGQIPSGSKDPFALRRASLGVLRLLVEKNLNLDLNDLLTTALQQYTKLAGKTEVVDQVVAYMLERFRAWYQDEAIPAEVFLAVNARKITTPLDFDNRVKAVHKFCQMAEAQSLAAANKRVSNILAKQGEQSLPPVNTQLLEEEAEKQLASEVATMTDQIKPLLDKKDYTKALETLAGLKSSVDTFFDSVMVMSENTQLRDNRLALLSQLRNLFLEVADISLLVPAKG